MLSHRSTDRSGNPRAATQEALKPFTPTVSLILVGYPGSGKSSVAAMLVRAAHVPVLEMGDVVRIEAAQDACSGSAIEFADRIFRQGRSTYFAELLLKRVSGEPRPLIVVGPRRPEEVNLLRSSIGPVVCIALIAVEDARRSRQREKLAADSDPELLDYWQYRDGVERAWGLDLTIQGADILIDASGALMDVAYRVRRAWVRASRGAARPTC